MRNVWVGENTQLLTPEVAKKRLLGGQTALDWATHNGVDPEMVVRANNGHFYPASTNDIVMSDKS